ncbi:hypothetical protein GmHk_15G044773 [Glycine max]|nr:hypothetical protein GmHk_15G044773 [Glycine max]
MLKLHFKLYLAQPILLALSSSPLTSKLVVLHCTEDHDRIMVSPPDSPPPPPPSPPPPLPPPSDASASPSAMKRTHKATLVHVDPATGKADSPDRKKLRTYLGIVARDKVDVTYENGKEVPTAQKDLIWEDIQVEFEIPEASDSRTKKKLLKTFKSDLTRKWALASNQDGMEDTVFEKYDIRKNRPSFARLAETLLGRMCRKWHRPSRNRTLPPTFCLVGKLLAEKTKKKLEEAAQSGSVDGIIDPPSPVRRHVKWKMARTKKTREMMTEAAKEITEKIDSFEEQASQGSFVPHGR